MIATDFYRLTTPGLRSSNQLNSNLVPRVFSLSNMAAAGEKTLAHSEIKRSLISAFHGAFIHALRLVYYFQNKDGSSLSSSWELRRTFFSLLAEVSHDEAKMRGRKKTSLSPFSHFCLVMRDLCLHGKLSQCLRPKRWTEFLSDRLENCD